MSKGVPSKSDRHSWTVRDKFSNHPNKDGLEPSSLVRQTNVITDLTICFNNYPKNKG